MCRDSFLLPELQGKAAVGIPFHQSAIVDGHLWVTQKMECQSIARGRYTRSTIRDDSVGLEDLFKAFLELFHGR